MRVYAYLRASTDEQDASRALDALKSFAKSHGFKIAATFTENESGATLSRPELFRVLDVAQAGDVLLVEQVDRISRLNAVDWQTLRQIITTKGVRVVALDLPTSHQFLTADADSFTGRMMAALNAMMLDVLAAVARKDYEDRRRRQSEGIAKAKKAGKYKGRPADLKQYAHIKKMLDSSLSYREISEALGCSFSTIKAAKKHYEKTA
jgi:DNA invertase Pin-like site-specific DNA recombinase